MRDGEGIFELVVKIYFLDFSQFGGVMSNILDCILLGEEVEVCGFIGEIVYNGGGKFVVLGKDMIFKRVNVIVGGLGLILGYVFIVCVVIGEGEIF